jgi:hypothetical protein
MMEELKMKSLSLSILMVLAGTVSSFAGASVWSFDKQRGNDVQPAYWYSYQDSTTQTYGVLKDLADGYKEFSATLNLNLGEGKTSATGFGIAWKQTNRQDVPIDLSSYDGLCLTYKATNPFRVDFKQSSVTDYNFYGVVLQAKDEFTSSFIDFKNLAQEVGWGKTVDLDLTQQLGVQMNYKTGIAEAVDGADKNKNVITIKAISLGECESSVVVADTSFKILEPYDKVQSVTLKAKDSLKVVLSKVFSVGVGESLTITSATTPTGLLTKVKPTGAVTLSDTLVYVPASVDKDTSATLIIFGVKGTESKSVQINVNITPDTSTVVGPVCPGDPSCPDNPPPPENHPTKVLAPYDTGAVVLDTIPESDTLWIPLAKLFADEDNDKLMFVVETSAPLMKNLTPLDKVTLKDSLALIPVNVKKDTSLIVAISATDTKSDLVKVSFIVSIKDLSRPPVAVDIEYETNEDEIFTVSGGNTIGKKTSDPDGDDFIVVLIDSTKYGKLTLFTNFGSFTYKPEQNFHGDDTLTYVLFETANHSVMSQKGTVVIHVKPVNDPPGFVVVDSTFLKDTLALDMDFDEDTVKQIKIPTKSLVFGDQEVNEGSQKFIYGAVGEKIVAAVDSVTANFYFISVKPVTGATGLATIFFYASDGIDSVGVKIGVKLISPKDVAQAMNDEYTAFNDTVLTVSAKDGVLANDKYPEGMTKGMTAELAQKPSHGTLTFNKDGSFTYKPNEGFEDVDRFGYYCVINETKSKAAIVTIKVEKRNQLPTVVVNPATLDTTVSEDFPSSKALKYPRSVIASWFKDPEGDSLTFTAKSKDGKLKVEVTDKGILEINSVLDSTGKSYVVVTATDKKSSSKSFEFCVTITAVNDKPVALRRDTVYVKDKSGWKVKWDLDTLVRDVDGDELTFTPNETSALKKYMTISMKGSVLTATAVDGVKFKEGQMFALGVTASDPSNANVTIPLYVVIGTKTGLMPQLAKPKNNWQNAVMAKRGTVRMMDMQGRVIWNAKLPVNPAEVMNASAQVQGRKILRVNNQTWTIK